MARLIRRGLLGYLLLETAVAVALIAGFGFGTALLVLVGGYLTGLMLAGSQVRRRLIGLGSAAGRAGALADGALLTVAGLLVFVPGLVSTVTGLLLLTRPVRALAGPALQTALLGRLFAGTAPPRAPAGDGVIDGEVVDVVDLGCAAGSVECADGAATA